jgi:hypothetical protein
MTEDRPAPEEREETDRAAADAARIGGSSGNAEFDETELDTQRVDADPESSAGKD